MKQKSAMYNYKLLELQAHVGEDEVIHKVLQETGEVVEAHFSGDRASCIWEVKDALVNILSISDAFGIEVAPWEKKHSVSVEELLISLSRWNTSVQWCRQRYLRQTISKKELQESTKVLVENILSFSPETVSFEQIILENTQKLKKRVPDYKPKIDLKNFVKAYPNFPKEGVLFRDISPLLTSPEAMRYVSFELAMKCSDAEVIVWLDARGFIFATLVAWVLQKPMVMLRKKGKLPGETVSQNYGLEYGKDTLEIQQDVIKAGQKVAIIDDLLATGWTAQAAAVLIEKIWAKVEAIICVVSLDEEVLKNSPSRKEIESLYRVESVLSYQ